MRGALQRWICHLAAQCGEAPRRGLRVEAEADVAGERVRVAEDALERIALVDAVRARHRMELVDGLGAQVDREREVALPRELGQRAGDFIPRCDRLPFDAVVAQDESRGIYLRARGADAQ